MEPASFFAMTFAPRGRMGTSPMSRAFTLIEMMVVLSIITILSVVILTGQSSYNRTLVLNDTAYSVAASLREAQTFGLSSRSYNAVQNTGYGLLFDRTTPDRYVLFADTDNAFAAAISWCPIGTPGQPDYKTGDCIFSGGTDAVLSTTAFTGGFKISRYCAITLSSVKYCSDDYNPLTQLDVVFQRPNTTTILTGRRATVPNYTQMKCAEVHITSQDGLAERVIRISRFGEISLNQSCPLI